MSAASSKILTFLKARKGEKVAGAKYYRREPRPNGGYRYFYSKEQYDADRQKVADRIVDQVCRFFHCETKVDAHGVARSEYERQGIQRRGISAGDWAHHWYEYWGRRSEWDRAFSRPRAPQGVPARNSGTPVEKQSKQPKVGLYSRKIMRLIHDLYGGMHNVAESDTTAQGDLFEGFGDGFNPGGKDDSGDGGKGRSEAGEGPGISAEHGVGASVGTGDGRRGDGDRPRRLTAAEQRTVNERVRDLLSSREGDQFSEAEKSELRAYAGRGGIKGETGEGVLSEFYTPYRIVDKMWDLARQYVAPGTHVLEPSAGIGRFAEGRTGFHITQVEIDSDSARINRVLNPHAEVLNQPFQKLFMGGPLGLTAVEKYSGKKYDLVIGNPPYGAFQNEFKAMGEGRDHSRFEEYFIDRGLDALKPGGTMVYVVPSGFLRGAASKVKDRIASKGKLVEAYRLPNGVFPTTDVGTDIIVLKKEPGNREDLSGNNWFAQRSDAILGREHAANGRFGPEIRVSGDIGAVDGIRTRAPLTQATKDKIAAALRGRTRGTKVAPARPEAPKSVSHANREHRRFSETHTMGSFLQKYSMEYDAQDIEIWKRTNSDGSLPTDLEFDPERMAVHRGKRFHLANYLSGNIHEKLSDLELEKDSMRMEQYERQKEALLGVLPKHKPIEKITVSPLGSFAQNFVLKDGANLVDRFTAWLHRNVNAGQLRGSSVSDIGDYVTRNASRKTRYESKEGHEARLRRRREVGERLFNDFIQTGLDKEDRALLEQSYNRTFNAVVRPDPRRIPVFVDGMSKTWRGGVELNMNQAQVEGVAFLGQKGSGLLAYGVGVGKTLSGIVATVQSMQRGWCKRPVIIAPKGVGPNWLKTVQEVFPDLKVNYLGNMGSDLKGTQPHISDGELNIITYAGLQKLAFREDTVADLTDELQDAMVYKGITTGSERDKQKFRQKVKEQLGKAQKGGEFYVEDLGIDHVTVDECHNFKNVFAGARLERNEEDGRGTHNEFRNVQTGGQSDRAAFLWLLTQHIQKNNGGRGAYLLTATPFTNSPVEIYNVLSFMARDRLKALQIHNVNDFISAFAKLKSEYVIKGNGKIVQQDVIKEFQNLGELQNLVREYVDFRTGEEVGVQRPRLEERVVLLDMTEAQQDLIARGEKLYDSTDKENRAAKLKSINMQRMATLSPKLVTGEGHFVKDSPKLKYTFDVVGKVHKADPTVSQVVYLPRGNQYFGEAIDYLVSEHGLRKEQVAVIDGQTSAIKRESIMRDFNDKDGTVRVLIGSDAIKEGVNLQRNSPVLHNTFLDWNPTDTEQVRGRVWRQSNPFETANVVYPAMANSIDAVMYQKHDEKIRRISNLWSYKGDTIDVSDLDPEELKYAVIRDPKKRARYRVQQEIDGLRNQVVELNAQLAKLEMIASGTGQGSYLERSGIAALRDRAQHLEEAVSENEAIYKERVAKRRELVKREERGEKVDYSYSYGDKNPNYYLSEYMVNHTHSELQRSRDEARTVNARLRFMENQLEGLRIPEAELGSHIENIQEKIEEVETMREAIQAKEKDYVADAEREISAETVALPSPDEAADRDAAAIIASLRKKTPAPRQRLEGFVGASA